MANRLTPAGSEFQVNQGITGNSQQDPDVVPVADGRLAVVYEHFAHADGSDIDIYAQYINTNGTVSGAPITLWPGGGIQQNPAAAPRADAGFSVVWEDYGPLTGFPSSDPDIRAWNAVNAAGVPSGFTDIATLSVAATNPDIALLQDGSGRHLVAYEYAHSNSDHDIYFNVLNANGTTLFAPTADTNAQAVNNDIFYQFGPAVAASGNTALVVYTDTVSGVGSTNFINARLFDDTTNTFGSSIGIAFHSDSVFAPDVAGLSDGRYVITYTDQQQVFGRIYDPSTPNGAFLGPEFQISAQSGGFLRDPRVYGTIDGGFLATWWEWDGPATGYNIYAHRYDAHGAPYGDVFEANATVDNLQLYPSVGVNGPNALIAWQDYGSRPTDTSPTGIRAQAFTTPSFNYDSAQLGDFNNNGRADILLQNDNPASDASIAQTNTAGLISSFTSIGPVPSGYRIDGTGNFNSTAGDDILLRSPNSVAVWVMNGTTPQSVAVLGGTSPQWLNSGIGDFTGDGQSDLLFRNPGTNEIATWGVANNALSTVPKVLGSTSAQYHIVAVDDFTGDHQADILFRHDNGDIAIWRVANNALAGTPAVVGSTSTSYHVVGTGDFDGNGANDILFRNDNGDMAVWLLNSQGQLLGAPAAIGTAGLEFHVDGTGDLNGDGRDDILLRDANGQMAEWLMNGATFAAPPQAIGGAPVDYAIAAHHFDLV
jgi:hypothetical protein